MPTFDAIDYWNRAEGRMEREQVYGDRAVRWFYSTRLGQLLARAFLARAWVSRAAGWYYDSALSRRRIAAFVEQFGVDMDEFESGPFRSFNEFFVRRFRPGARKFCTAPSELSAFAEARYLAWDSIDAGCTYPVKGQYLLPQVILGGAERAAPFAGGPLVIARLCPVDYHRYHYPDGGITEQAFRVAGRLHSVNPLALRFKADIFATNERRVSLLSTEHFGRLAFVEVGATCVGRIVQTHDESRPFARGQEKGCFRFGASSVLLFGEPGRWRPAADLVQRTAERTESLVRLGEPIGQSGCAGTTGV